MKIYDFDGMFDEKLRDYMNKNTTIKGDEWEDVIPKLYQKFGDTTIKSIGKSPNTFYQEMTDKELISALSTHLKQGVSVNGYLKNQLDKRDIKPLLLPLLDGCDKEKAFAVNYLEDYAPAVEKYLDIIESDASVELKEECIAYIKPFADKVYDRLCSNVKADKESKIMLEILAFCLQNREAVFNLLLSRFNTDFDGVIENATNLANFGDERAIPTLLEKLEDERINYLQFREIKFALETLGGEYLGERNFEGDRTYEQIKEKEQESLDLFSKIFNS